MAPVCHTPHDFDGKREMERTWQWWWQQIDALVLKALRQLQERT